MKPGDYELQMYSKHHGCWLPIKISSLESLQKLAELSTRVDGSPYRILDYWQNVVFLFSGT